MKKLFLTLFFNILFCLPSFAQTISNQGIDKIIYPIRSQKDCWECALIEGVYTYTFNFVFKMYNVIKPVIYEIVIVFLGLWFLWFIATKVIKEQSGDIKDLLKDFFVKVFTILFVWAMLMKVPANEIFKYTIDPIMSFGAGFGKWILIETRNENSILQNKKLPKFNCEDIQLSKNTLDMFKNNKIDIEDSMNTNTLKNMICITREYSNAYTTGFNLGFKIASRGLIGIAGNFGAQKVKDIGENFVLLGIVVPWIGIVVNILFFIVQLFIWFGWAVNFLIIVLGLGIAICFMYVALTYITLILDIIIKLAMVGVMMPVVIGAWAFNGKDMTNLRGNLSKQLFWDVLRCSFRLVFLAIAMGISTFLLTELMTTSFDSNNQTVATLYESLVNPQPWTQNLFQWTGLNPSSRELLKLFVNNTGMIIAILFVTLVSWMLLTESNNMADSFSDSIYSGIKNDEILKGLKTLTISTIQYINSIPKRELVNYKRKKLAQKYYNKNYKKSDKETIEVIDLPVDYLIDRYKTQQENSMGPLPYNPFLSDDNTSSSSNSNINSQQINGVNNKNTSFNKSPFSSGIGPVVNIDMANIDMQISNEKKNLTEFVDEKFSSYDEYKNLTKEDKSKIEDIILQTSDDEIIDIIESSPAIAEFNNVIQSDTNILFKYVSNDKDLSGKSPLIQMKDEYIKNEILDMSKELGKNKKQINNFIKDGRKITTQKIKLKYIDYEKQVKDNLLSQKKKLDTLYEEKDILTKISKVNKNSRLTAKSVIQAIKKEEIEELTEQIDNLDTNILNNKLLSPQISYIRKQIKKLEKELYDIEEKEEIELEEEFDGFIKEREKRKKINSHINPNKKISPI